MMYASCPAHYDEIGRGNLSAEQERELLEKLPAFDPVTARSARDNGALVELFRTYPGSMVNHHVARFVAWGRHAEYLLSKQPWNYAFGRASALDRFVALDGKILLLGCDHDTVTFLHYAEHIVDIPGKRVSRFKVPVSDGGTRVWRDMEEFDTSDGAHPNWPDRFFARLVDTLSGRDRQPRRASRRRAVFPARRARVAGVCPACDAGRGRRPARGRQRLLGASMTHRFPIAPPIEPMLAKLATELPAGDGFLYRAEVGRLSRDRLSRRRRGLHPEPRPAAARSLLSRAARRAAGRAARRLRARRRDRDRHAARPRLRRAADAAASRRLARRQAREGDAGRVRRVRRARRRRAGSARRRAARAPRAAGAAARRRQAADSPDADDARSRAGVGMAVAIRGRRPRRRDRQARRRRPTSPASAR